MRNLVSVLVFLLAAEALPAQPHAGAEPHRSLAAGRLPKLVLQITIDQLRGDLPLRLQDRFTAHGFRYLLDHGTWYTAAHHPHAYAETVVGHTTLATGAYPSRHGMIANNWFDRIKREPVSNIESKTFHLVGAETTGASPELIPTSTFSDELAVTTAGRSKIFAVSFKDRGAVPLAGHAGKAFWFSKATGCFVSSTFYFNAYPAWVNEWCGRGLAKSYENKTWPLLRKDKYLFRDNHNQYDDGTPPQTAMQLLDTVGFGRTFPHHLPPGKMFSELLSISPFIDHLTLDFAETLIEKEGLGKDDVPDYLAISFSATDLIGHMFGPSSLESEDNLLRLDRTLDALFTYIDRTVGLANTLIVMAGDHGGPELPEVLERMHINTGRVTEDAIRDAAQHALDTRFGKDGTGIILNFSYPNIYLDRSAIAGNKQDLAEIEDLIIAAVMNVPGVALAVPTRRLGPEASTDAELLLQIARNQNAARSGDIFVVEKPQWQVDHIEPKKLVLLQHGAPWPYDTYVPIAFGGAGIPARRVSRAVSTVDVAATLAVALRTRFPSGCVGVPLTEVLDQK